MEIRLRKGDLIAEVSKQETLSLVGLGEVFEWNLGGHPNWEEK